MNDNSSRVVASSSTTETTMGKVITDIGPKEGERTLENIRTVANYRGLYLLQDGENWRVVYKAPGKMVRSIYEDDRDISYFLGSNWDDNGIRAVSIPRSRSTAYEIYRSHRQFMEDNDCYPIGYDLLVIEEKMVKSGCPTMHPHPRHEGCALSEP